MKPSFIPLLLVSFALLPFTTKAKSGKDSAKKEHKEHHRPNQHKVNNSHPKKGMGYSGNNGANREMGYKKETDNDYETEIS